MEVEVFLNGNRLDTNSDTQISETKQINDFFEIQDRQASYSNSFTVPETPNNRKIFKMLGLAGSTSLTPYRLAKIEVRRRGIPTISGGFAKVTETSNGFKINAYDGTIDLYNKIGSKKISELDFSDLGTHQLNEQNWKASFTHTFQNGYIYAIADYGNSESNNINFTFQVPSLFVKYLWNKIFSEAGFNYEYIGELDVFESDEFEEMIISLDNGVYQPIENDDLEGLILEMENQSITNLEAETITFLGNLYVVQALEFGTVEYVKFNLVSDTQNLINSSFSNQYNKTRVEIAESGFYKFDILGFVFNESTTSLALYVELNGNILFTISDTFSEGNNDVDFTELVFLEEGDQIEIKFISDPNDLILRYNYNLNVKLFENSDGLIVNFNSFLTSITQKKFLKDVMHHFGLLQQRKGYTYQFLRIEELLTDYDNAENWSDKFSERETEKYSIGSYAQKNYLKYKYLNENDKYANATIQIDDQTIDNETDIIQRIYNAPANSVVSVNNKRLKSCLLYEKSYEDDGTLKEIKAKKTNPYLMRIERNSGSFEYYPEGSENTSTYSGTYPVGTFNNFNMNEIVANHYASFSNMVSLAKKNNSNLFLSVIDIYELDFLRLKFIKQLGGFFYLNKIQGFTGNKKTKTELIHVKSIVELGEYNNDYGYDYNI